VLQLYARSTNPTPYVVSPHFVSLRFLDSNALQGPLPASLAALVNLQVFDAHNNSLSGSIDVMRSWSSLQIAYISQNQFSGCIPDLSGLTSLQHFVAYTNSFACGLPAWLPSHPSLQTVYLASNPLGGVLPSFAGAVASPLTHLDLSNCSLVGPIPPSLSVARRLQMLALAFNRLTGPVPDSLASLANADEGGVLQLLLLRDNALDGVIPPLLLAPTFPYISLAADGLNTTCIRAAESSLVALDLSNNLMSGSVALSDVFSIDTCQRLHYTPRTMVQLLLAGNSFNGSVPPSVLLPPMSTLSLSYNMFDGELPQAVPGFSTVRSVGLASNNFAGVIPSSYTTLGELNNLDVAANRQLQTSCLQPIGEGFSTCLPAFLRVDDSTMQSFVDGSVCASVTGTRAALQLTIDQQTYLRGAQCYCNATTFQAPVNQTAVAVYPVCVACEPSAWCKCGGYNVPMRACWAELRAGGLRTNRSDWQALPCPFVASPAVTACRLPAQAVCNDTDDRCQCTEGYHGRRCSQCVDGYYASGRSCEQCAPSLHALLPVVWVVLLIGFSAYLILVPGSASSALKIASFYVQSVLLLVSNARVPWPLQLRQLIYSTAETGSLSASALECVVPGITELQQYVVFAVTPLGLVAISAAVYAVGRLRRWADAGNVFVYMTLSMLMTTYFNVTLKALAGVSCTLPDGYNNMYPWLECSSDNAAFRTIGGLSIVCLLLYTAGVPVLSALLLNRQRGRRETPAVQRQLGFLYGGYRDGAFMWEFVVLGRRLALALALTLVPFTIQQVEVIAVIVVLVGSIALQHAVMPFATVLENRLELLSLYSLLFSFLGVYVAESSASTSAPLDWLPVVIVVILVATAAVLFVAVALVLLVRVLPSLNTAFGGRLAERSELVQRVALKASDLGVHLLERQSDTMGSDRL
jgi:hypothetical protein